MAVTVWSAWVVGAAALGLAASLIAQEAVPDKGAIEGTARNSVTMLGLGKVSIHLIPANSSLGYSGYSKSDGTFRFEGLIAGDYSIQAQRAGYSGQAVLTDKSGHSISTLHLAPGQTAAGNSLWFTPEGAISGTVTGPDGEPLPSAAITLIAQIWRRGKRVYTGISSESTNDTGAYRFPSVAPGRYWIYAGRPQEGPLARSILESPGSPEMRIAGRYHPNSAQLDGAAAIELHAGEEIPGIDLKLPLMPVFHVMGTYRGQGDAGVVLKPRFNDQALDWAAEGARPGPDGKFDITGVMPGSYFVSSFESDLRDRLTSPRVPLLVGAQDIAGVAAPAVARLEIKGRIRVEDGDSAEKAPVEIFLEGSEADAYSSFQRRAEPESDGSFAVQNLTADRYRVRIANLYTGKEGGLYLKSVRAKGVELTGRELDLTRGSADDVELVLSPDAGSVEGTVRRTEERQDDHRVPEPAPELTMVLIPEKLASEIPPRSPFISIRMIIFERPTWSREVIAHSRYRGSIRDFGKTPRFSPRWPAAVSRWKLQLGIRKRE